MFTVAALEQDVDSASAMFTYVSPSGKAGYPGQLIVMFTAVLNVNNQLAFWYKATTDSPTIVPLTNRTYWNLNGHDGTSIMDSALQLHCSSYAQVEGGRQGAPTGDNALCQPEAAWLTF